MAYTAISDVIDPEVLSDQLSAKFPDMLILGNTNLVEVDPNANLGAPGSKLKMPSWKRIGAFGSLTEGTSMTPGKISTYSEFATVQRAGAAFEVLNTAELVSKADPVAEIANQLARRGAEYIDNSLVTIAGNTPNVFDQTGASHVDSVYTMTQNVINKGLLTLGDNRGKILQGGALIVHSKVLADMLSLGAIQNQYQFGGDVLKTGSLPMIMGLPVFTSDLVPNTTATVNGVANTPVFTSFIVGPGALALFYQRKMMVEFDRDILLQADVVAATVHFASHLWGYDDQSSAVVAEQAKSIHVVKITTA